jgi:hypothetical protein
MKIEDRDIAAIKALGYTEDEARFLYIVATHSGYFVPRQFLDLTGASWGYRTDQLSKKLESRGHATWREYEGTGGVYHLFSKKLYAEIGKANLRNRRRHSVEFIRTRLVLLDFVIANQQHDYLETEERKVEYFCNELGLPKTSLPTKTYEGSCSTEPTLRYFVDKYPLFLDSSRLSSSPVVTLSYVDPGYSTLAGFANHLNAYRPLFRELNEFQFLLISNSPVHFADAEKCFSSVVRAPISTEIAADVLRYFRLRKAWDLKKYALFSNNEIEWLNDATRRFQGDRFDALHAGWCSGKLTDDEVRRQFPPATPTRRSEFQTFLVRGNRREDGPSWKALKRSSGSDFRRKDFSLQPLAEANSRERRELPREEKTGKNAAKFG